MHAIPIIAGAALLAMTAVSAGAQEIKETLTQDPEVVRSLEPSPTPQGTRSPDPIDTTDDESGLQGALDRLENNSVSVQGRDLERQTQDSGQAQSAQSTGSLESPTSAERHRLSSQP